MWNMTKFSVHTKRFSQRGFIFQIQSIFIQDKDRNSILRMLSRLHKQDLKPPTYGKPLKSSAQQKSSTSRMSIVYKSKTITGGTNTASVEAT